MRNLYTVILAAGKGTRMRSSQAKVLHKICGIPMLRFVFGAASGLDPAEVIVVIGQDAERVRECLDGLPAQFVLQSEQLGTGHALMSACGRLSQLSGDVVVLFGDTPGIKTSTLRDLVDHHRRSEAALTLITSRADDPFGYGRILRNGRNGIEAIVEEKDATPEQRRIREVNPGFYCFQIHHLVESVARLTNDNAQKEYYITDLAEILRKAGQKVETLQHPDFDELKGINTRVDLAEISKRLAKQRNLDLMESGVTLLDPQNTYVELDVLVEQDVTLYPMVTLEGKTRIGEGCIIRSGSRIADSTIGTGAMIMDSCLITDSTVGQGSTIGPFARLRENTVIGRRCRVGDFVEIKKSVLGDDTRAAHLAYLGDANVGNNVNIGAGVITCNFDGERKNVTIIEDDAFIGTDSQLVAPVRIGRGAYVAAGSCITQDVPEGALGIARGRQQVKKDWVRRRRAPRDVG